MSSRSEKSHRRGSTEVPGLEGTGGSQLTGDWLQLGQVIPLVS